MAHNGAGDGNRTHVTSLEGWSSAIELHPRSRTRMESGAVDETRTRDLNLGKVALYQLSYYRMQAWTQPWGKWCGRRDLNSYAVGHQILSLARLPIPPRPRVWPQRGGDPSATRTRDTLIKSQVLCQLS